MKVHFNLDTSVDSLNHGLTLPPGWNFRFQLLSRVPYGFLRPLPANLSPKKHPKIERCDWSGSGGLSGAGLAYSCRKATIGSKRAALRAGR